MNRVAASRATPLAFCLPPRTSKSLSCSGKDEVMGGHGERAVVDAGGEHAPSSAPSPAESARTETSLRERLARLESVIEGSQAGAWEWNVQTDQLYFNERW